MSEAEVATGMAEQSASRLGARPRRKCKALSRRLAPEIGVEGRPERVATSAEDRVVHRQAEYVAHPSVSMNILAMPVDCRLSTHVDMSADMSLASQQSGTGARDGKATAGSGSSGCPPSCVSCLCGPGGGRERRCRALRWSTPATAPCPGAVPPGPRGLRSGRDGGGLRGREPPEREPPHRLRPALEPEPHRAALRPESIASGRPRSASCGTWSRWGPARATSTTASSRGWRPSGRLWAGGSSTSSEVDKALSAVHSRLTKEIHRLTNRAIALDAQVQKRRQPAMQPLEARRDAEELEARLDLRAKTCAPRPARQDLRAKTCAPRPARQDLRAKTCAPRPARQDLRAKTCAPRPARQDLRAKTCAPRPAHQDLRTTELEARRHRASNPPRLMAAALVLSIGMLCAAGLTDALATSRKENAGTGPGSEPPPASRPRHPAACPGGHLGERALQGLVAERAARTFTVSGRGTSDDRGRSKSRTHRTYRASPGGGSARIRRGPR